MKKDILFRGILCSLLCCSNVYAHGGGGDDHDHDKCKTSLSITDYESLEFGDIAAASAGSVSIDTYGVRTATGGLFLLNDDGEAAEFKIRGCPNYNYTIVLPYSATMSSGNNQMLLNSFISRPADNSVLNASGYQQLLVGATLHANTNQPAGEYKGNFLIEVIYD